MHVTAKAALTRQYEIPDGNGQEKQMRTIEVKSPEGQPSSD